MTNDLTRTASPTTVAFRALPADIQALSFDAVGHLPRPMSHMEMLLAVGQAVLAERERCARIARLADAWPEPNYIAESIERGDPQPLPSPPGASDE